MVETLAEGSRKAKRPHQCFHCYRTIPKGEVYGYQTNAYEGRVYTLKWHADCEECAHEVRLRDGDQWDEEGWGPLRDQWCDSGEYDRELDWWRGHYPHVIARMELTDQLRGPSQ